MLYHFSDEFGTPDLQDEEENLITPNESEPSLIGDHIADLSKGVSLKRKNNSAHKHIEYCLKHYIKIKDDNDQIIEKLENLPIKCYTDDLCGKIGTYFAMHARKRLKDNAPLVSLTTAVNYMSALKSYFIEQYR